MNTRNTELPREKRKDDKRKNRQLATIIHNTDRWMEVLYHECNGLFSNINWVSKIMQNEMEAEKVLPKEAFGELNQSTQNNIYILKAIHSYIQVMNAIANRRAMDEDMVIINEDMLFASVPKMLELEVQYTGLTLKVTRSFAKVLMFLLNKMLEVAQQVGVESGQLNLAFNSDKEQRLQICVSSTTLFWHHELWEQRVALPLAAICADSSEWARQMFYELLALVDGKILSGCTQQRNFSHVERGPRLAAELIQREISAQRLEFSIPFGLDGK